MGEFLGDPWRWDLWSLVIFHHFPMRFFLSWNFGHSTSNKASFFSSLPASPKLYKICSWMASSCLIPPSRSWSNGSCNLAASLWNGGYWTTHHRVALVESRKTWKNPIYPNIIGHHASSDNCWATITAAPPKYFWWILPQIKSSLCWCCVAKEHQLEAVLFNWFHNLWAYDLTSTSSD